MATYDWTGTDVIPNGSGSAVRADLNDALLALFSQNSSATEPPETVAYMTWADTATGLYKIRNAANNGWITLYQLDGEWTTIALENGTAAAPSLYFKDSGTDTGLYSPGTDQVAIATAGVQRVNFNGATEVVFNDGGADVDLRIEGDTKANLFKVDAGTDAVLIDGTQQLVNQTPLRFGDSDNSNYVGLRAAATVASSVTWDLPSTDGASSEALITDGGGVLSFKGTTCRAWVNFNGTGTVAIRASYNVSSITDNGTGDYTVNFTTAMADVNYCAISSSRTSSGTAIGCMSAVTYNTGSVRVFASGEISSGGLNYVGANFNTDHSIANVAIFR